MDHYYFMSQAIKEAKKALAMAEVPVGAVVVQGETIIGRGHNRKETDNSPIAHGEILALTQAAAALNNWRLDSCTLYVTLEPCPMCCGAILQSRIKEVVFGAWDLKWGGAGTKIDVLQPGLFNHTVEVTGGIREKECGELLTNFFRRQGEKNSGSQ
ncbi:MAG: tRNA adenosine(34) deaminase TadA [Bacillota bacterium]|nr:tRNA adenosine(34) deaminase TadA [Bacillota bacterium]